MTDHFILIGHPVGHSLSPVIHQAAYEHLGLDAHYELVDCPSRQDVERQVARLRAGELRGANVTVPHKATAFELVDEVSETAKRVGVANVLSRAPSGKIVAHNTDASGLARQLERCLHVAAVPQSRCSRALVVGNGGAARGAVVACQLAGLSEVAVTARKFQGPEAAFPGRDELRSLGARLLPWWSEGPEAARFAAHCGLIVQATSAGMAGIGGGEELSQLVPWSSFEPLVVYDLVYRPRRTPFLMSAQEAGHFTEDGLSMLVGQARDALRIWLDEELPEELLLRAAENALS